MVNKMREKITNKKVEVTTKVFTKVKGLISLKLSVIIAINLVTMLVHAGRSKLIEENRVLML